jgi:hypothetical protein
VWQLADVRITRAHRPPIGGSTVIGLFGVSRELQQLAQLLHNLLMVSIYRQHVADCTRSIYFLPISDESPQPRQHQQVDSKHTLLEYHSVMEHIDSLILCDKLLTTLVIW